MAFSDSSAIKSVADQFNKLRAEYHYLAERDRLALLGLVIFLSAVMVLYLVWLPANERLNVAKSRYDKNASTLAWVKSHEGEVRQAGRGQKTQGGLKGRSILTVVNQTANQNRLRVKRVEPKGEESLRVWFDNVSFNNLIVWLDQLSSRYGITAVNVNIEHKQEEGLVNVSLIVRT